MDNFLSVEVSGLSGGDEMLFSFDSRDSGYDLHPILRRNSGTCVE